MKQTELFKNKEWSKMHSEEESDQLQSLEQKVGALIEEAKALKQENAALAETLQTKKKVLANLSQELQDLKKAGDKAEQRTATLLMKIEQVIGKIDQD